MALVNTVALAIVGLLVISGATPVEAQRVAFPVPVVVRAADPADLPPEADGWSIRIETHGGVLGTGRGDILVTSRGALACQRAGGDCPSLVPSATLSRLQLAVDSASLLGSAQVGPSLCSDCYTTVFSITRRTPNGAHTVTASWDVTTRREIPEDILAIHDLIVAVARAPAAQ
jgi:hypothetical protein